jgi:hypothetical protein
MAIAIKTYLGRNDSQGRRLAFRAVHRVPLNQKSSENAKKQPEEKFTLIFFDIVFQQLI